MKVLHLGKFDSFGGIERHVQSLVSGLVATGDVSAVNLVANNRAQTDQHDRYGYCTVRAASFGVLASVALCPTMPLIALQLHRRYRFDLVHLHFPDPLGQLTSSILPKSVARIVSWHSDIVRQQRAMRLYGPTMERFLKGADAIVGATPLHFSSSTQIPSSVDASRRFVIPYGFDPRNWTMTDIAAKRLAELRSQKSDRFAVFALGRHVYYKGFDVLIDAMRTVDGVLWLGGEGPETDALAQRIRAAGLTSRIFLTGSIPDNELAAYYEACDVFCLPSTERSEQFGLVQLEAMYFRRPVVSTRLGTGVEWVNQHERTGLLVAPKDAAALAAALRALAADAPRRIQMGTAGRQRVLEEFSCARMAASTQAMYATVLKRRASR